MRLPFSKFLLFTAVVSSFCVQAVNFQPGEWDVMPVYSDTDLTDTVKTKAEKSPLKGIDIRWGWSMLSDDGSFFQNPLFLDNWKNVTLRSVPATFSVHFPYSKKENGRMSQWGIQTMYSASEALRIGEMDNFGVAHYFSTNMDFRTTFPTINYLGTQGNMHVNYGAGYTYKSVALVNHEAMLHFGLGWTAWMTPRFGITLSGIGNFGTLHILQGTNYLQATAMATYRL
jgi:hypothetical protein